MTLEATVKAFQESKGREADKHFAVIFDALRGAVGGIAKGRIDRQEDLFQEGSIILLQCAREYDAARGIPFEAYATQRIRWGIAAADRPAKRNKTREAFYPVEDPPSVPNQLAAAELAQALDSLDPQARRVCILLVQGHTTREVASEVGVSFQRVSQINKETVSKLTKRSK